MIFFTNINLFITVDLAHYGVSRAKDWDSADCGYCVRSAMFLFDLQCSYSITCNGLILQNVQLKSCLL